MHLLHLHYYITTLTIAHIPSYHISTVTITLIAAWSVGTYLLAGTASALVDVYNKNIPHHNSYMYTSIVAMHVFYIQYIIIIITL